MENKKESTGDDSTVERPVRNIQRPATKAHKPDDQDSDTLLLISKILYEINIDTGLDSISDSKMWVLQRIKPYLGILETKFINTHSF